MPAAEITIKPADFEAGDVWRDGQGTQWFAFRWGGDIRVVNESGFRFRLEFFLTVVDLPLALLYRRAGKIARKTA